MDESELAMKYADGRPVVVGDRVRLWQDEYGTVVCSIDGGDYTIEYPKSAWGYLDGGILIKTDNGELFHYDEPDEDFELIARGRGGLEEAQSIKNPVKRVEKARSTMPRAQRSGITVDPADVPVILAMIARGDRRHDVAAWFGLNQGRLKEVEDGRHGPLTLAPSTDLPPSGSPGIKARQLRRSVARIRGLLGANDVEAAKRAIEEAIAQFDQNE